MDAAGHGKIVLSAILPNRRDLLEKATGRLVPDHFVDKTQRTIFTMLERYADKTDGSVMPEKFLEDHLRDKVESGQTHILVETYKLYGERDVPDDEFLWSLDQLRDLASEKETVEALTNAMEIVKEGKETSGGVLLKGHTDARGYLLESFVDIDRELNHQESPEGDMMEEESDMLQDYLERKDARLSGTSRGIEFGIPTLDNHVQGLQRGDLCLIAGYSSDGKTTLVTQLAWHAAVMQGKNVVFFTTETLRPQVRRKLIARHSTLPLFDNPEGLNTRDLRGGTLKASEEKMLKKVVNDFTSNPEYGRIYIAQVPRGATITSLEQRLIRISRNMRVDLVIMDYLGLLASEYRRQNVREELKQIIIEAKQVATTFNDGQGVPFVSPWQVSREARQKAESLGMYTSAGLSETAEATNSSDVLVSLLAPTDNTNRRAEIMMQVMKNRDGETASGLLVEVDYATATFIARGGSSFQSAKTSIMSADPLESVL